MNNVVEWLICELTKNSSKIDEKLVMNEVYTLIDEKLVINRREIRQYMTRNSSR